MDPTFDLTDDDDLVIALRQAVPATNDVVPRAVHEFALAVYDLGSLDVELAALIHDSLVDAPSVAARASEDDPRVIVYSAAGTSIELRVTGERELLGQVAPAGVDEVQVQTASESMVVVLDEFGQFETAAPDALMRVLVRQEGRTVATPWMRL